MILFLRCIGKREEVFSCFLCIWYVFKKQSFENLLGKVGHEKPWLHLSACITLFVAPMMLTTFAFWSSRIDLYVLNLGFGYLFKIFLILCHKKMRYSCQGDVLLLQKREGDTIKKKKILIIKATCDPGLLSGAQRHWGKLFSKPKRNFCDPQDTPASSR